MNVLHNKSWDRKEWESHVNRLLRIHHKPTEYIPIPDKDKGDGGIEGYSLTGNAYQCYLPDDDSSGLSKVDRQRNKITTDIDKFIDNHKVLSGLFGSTIIKRWILVTPDHYSKKLISHANAKTKLVLDACLPYVDKDDFQVLIWDRETLISEERELIKKGLHKIQIEAANDPSMSNDIKINQPELISKLQGKLINLLADQHGNCDEDTLDAATKELLTRFVQHRVISDQIQSDYPEQFSELDNIKRRKERDLALIALSGRKMAPNDHKVDIADTIDKTEMLHKDTIDTYAWGLVADWLMRCPLDYK